MNVFRNISKRIEKGLENNTRSAVVSLILAIIVWLMISMGLDQSAPKTIRHIKLNLDYSGTSVAENELSIIPFDEPEIEIKIRGSKTQIRNLNADTFEAYVDFDGITSACRKTLPIKLTNTEGISYELESITPSTVTIEFDRYTTIDVPVIPKLSNVTPAEGKILDEYTCEPNVVSLLGPASRLEKVSKCYVCTDKAFKDIDSSFNITLTADNLQLYSSDDVLLDKSDIKFPNATSFFITVPVLTQKMVTPVVEISNVPEGFDKNFLKEKLRFSPESLVIASNNSNAEISDTFEVQKINLSDFDLGYSKDFDISEKIANANVINKSEVDTVTVSLDDTGLTRKEITLDSSRIHISDVPSDNYNYKAMNTNLTVTVVGPAEVLDQLTSKDFVASASLLNIDKAEQKLSFDAAVSCLASNEVWSVTKAKITIMKTPKNVDTVEDTENTDDTVNNEN